MDAFVYAADLICRDCARAVHETLKTAAGWTYRVDEDQEETWTGPAQSHYGGPPALETFSLEGYVLDARGRSLGTDTDTFPSGPTADGGGETDSPAHCGDCGLFLEAPLTRDGEKYVLESVAEAVETGRWDSIVLSVWLPFYRDGLELDGPAHAALDLTAALAKTAAQCAKAGGDLAALHADGQAAVRLLLGT